MTTFHLLQLILLAAALAATGRAAWSYVNQTSLEGRLFLTAWADALCNGEKDEAGRLLDGASSCTVAKLLQASCNGSQDLSGPDVVISKLREETLRPAGRVRALGRIASPLAFIGVMIELGAAFADKQGLAGLQRGAVETVALEHAVLGLVLGLATSSICIAAAGQLARGAATRLGEFKLAQEVYEAVNSWSVET